ncbi:hypothetical protein [Cellulomonas septica]|nr:hypothetical protein [Cellulomonas septica]
MEYFLWLVAGDALPEPDGVPLDDAVREVVEGGIEVRRVRAALGGEA